MHDCGMSPYAFLKRHMPFKRSPQPPPPLEKETATQPATPHTTPSPPRQTTPPRKAAPSPPLRPRISASSIPKWTWTNGHCKAWIYEICVAQLGYSAKDAQAMCGKFVGFGPTLYAMDRDEWGALLGQYNGMGVYSMLSRLRYQADVVPENVEMPFGENVKGDGRGKKLRGSWRKKN